MQNNRLDRITNDDLYDIIKSTYSVKGRGGRSSLLIFCSFVIVILFILGQVIYFGASYVYRQY